MYYRRQSAKVCREKTGSFRKAVKNVAEIGLNRIHIQLLKYFMHLSVHLNEATYNMPISHILLHKRIYIIQISILVLFILYIYI